MVRARLAASALGALACVSPPPIIMVDRATALEQQAAGSYPELEKKLAHASVASHPPDITPNELELIERSTPPLVDRTEMTDAERLDDLLERHCVGEGIDGSLVDTLNTCLGLTDHDDVLLLVDRANRARAQVWRRLQEQRPTTSLAEIRKQWRDTHMRGVVCGAWVQGEGGRWSEKAC